MDQQVDCRHESRHADSRTPRRLMNYKSIVIESQASADVPAPKSYLVLYVNGRLDIPFSLVRKRKIQLCPGIELRWIGNRVLERFVHWTEDAVHSRFPIVMSAVPDEVSSRVSFAVAAVLRYDHRCGCRVRCHRRARVPTTSRKDQK